MHHLSPVRRAHPTGKRAEASGRYTNVNFALASADLSGWDFRPRTFLLGTRPAATQEALSLMNRFSATKSSRQMGTAAFRRQAIP